jgi:hypothetical protein
LVDQKEIGDQGYRAAYKSSKRIAKLSIPGSGIALSSGAIDGFRFQDRRELKIPYFHRGIFTSPDFLSGYL